MKIYKSITKILAMGIILSLATPTLGQQGIHTIKDTIHTLEDIDYPRPREQLLQLAIRVTSSLAMLTLGQKVIHSLKDDATKTSSGLGSGVAKTLVRPCIDQIATQATTTKKSLVLKSFSFLKNAPLNYYRFLDNRLTNIGSGLKGLANIIRGKDFGSEWTSKNTLDFALSILSITAIHYVAMNYQQQISTPIQLRLQKLRTERSNLGRELLNDLDQLEQQVEQIEQYKRARTSC